MTTATVYSNNNTINFSKLTTTITCTRRRKPTTLKRVRFSADIDMELVLSRAEYGKQEIKDCWMTSKEKSKSRAKHLQTIARLESGKSPKQGQTYRGLEAYMSDDAEEAIERCINAVMDEQDEQWKNCHDDYAMLAIASMRATSESKRLLGKSPKVIRKRPWRISRMTKTHLRPAWMSKLWMFLPWQRKRSAARAPKRDAERINPAATAGTSRSLPAPLENLAAADNFDPWNRAIENQFCNSTSSFLHHIERQQY